MENSPTTPMQQTQAPMQEMATQPTQQTESVMQQSSGPSKSLYVLVAVLLLIIVGAGAYYFGTQQSTKMENYPTEKMAETSTPVASATPITTTTETPSSETSDNRYINQDFGISFTLEPGERVKECPNVNEYNDNISLWVATGSAPTDPRDECATDAMVGSILISKKSQGPQTIENYIEQQKGSGYEYQITTEPITISGISGLRVKGDRGAAEPAPLPNTIDELVFEKDGVLYLIPATFLQRDVSLLAL